MLLKFTQFMLQRLFARLWPVEGARLENELLERLEDEGVLVLNRRLAKSFATDCGRLLRVACALAGNERLHILARSGDSTMFMSNSRYVQTLRDEAAAETELSEEMPMPSGTLAADEALTDDEAWLLADDAGAMTEDLESALIADAPFDDITLSKPTLSSYFAQSIESQKDEHKTADRETATARIL